MIIYVHPTFWFIQNIQTADIWTLVILYIERLFISNIIQGQVWAWNCKINIVDNNLYFSCSTKSIYIFVSSFLVISSNECISICICVIFWVISYSRYVAIFSSFLLGFGDSSFNTQVNRWIHISVEREYM